jgi:hypothetical protein
MIAVAGAVVWIPVTDHPNHPRKCAVGDAFASRTEEECQQTCDAWNREGAPFRWYPLQVVVQQRGFERGPQMRLL